MIPTKSSILYDTELRIACTPLAARKTVGGRCLDTKRRRSPKAMEKASRCPCSGGGSTALAPESLLFRQIRFADLCGAGFFRRRCARVAAAHHRWPNLSHECQRTEPGQDRIFHGIRRRQTLQFFWPGI